MKWSNGVLDSKKEKLQITKIEVSGFLFFFPDT
jgi:hypothetical protein